MIMMDIYMVGIWQCHIPTPIHYDIFPPGGNMAGGNMLVSHDDDDDDGDGDDDYNEDDDDNGYPAYSHLPYSHQVGIWHNE